MLWPLSCYAYHKETPCLPGFSDISPEELRWEAYQAKTKNTSEQYLQQIRGLSDKHLKTLNMYARTTADDVENLVSKCMKICLYMGVSFSLAVILFHSHAHSDQVSCHHLHCLEAKAVLQVLIFSLPQTLGLPCRLSLDLHHHFRPLHHSLGVVPKLNHSFKATIKLLPILEPPYKQLPLLLLQVHRYSVVNKLFSHFQLANRHLLKPSSNH